MIKWFILVISTINASYIQLTLQPSTIVRLIGDRSATNAICSGLGGTPWALLDYTYSPLVSFTLPPLQTPVFYLSTVIGTYNDLLSSNLPVTFAQAGLLQPFAVGKPSINCGNFFSSQTTLISVVYADIYSSNWWNSIFTSQCSPWFKPLLSLPWMCLNYYQTTSPTNHPTFLQLQVARYRVKKQQTPLLSIGRGWYSELSPPIKTIIKGVELEPVLFTNVNWTLYGVPQFITSCNPIPTTLPGELIIGPNGLIICPTTIKCQNPTFKACLTNYTVEIRTDLPTIQDGEGMLISGNFSSTAPQPQPPLAVSCNSAIEREINCQTARKFPLYKPECLDAPITCYENQTLGYGFGLFWNQNPNFNYEYGNWSEGHFRGIASILNFKKYFTNGVLTDPLNSKNLNNYYWEQGGGSSTVAITVVKIPIVLQLLANYIKEEPTTTNFISFQQFLDCLTTFQTSCLSINWKNLPLEWKLPGIWVYFNFTVSGVGQLTTNQPVQIEIWENQKKIFTNLTLSTDFQFPIQKQISIRILNGSWWDIPATKAINEEPTPPDPRWAALSPFPFTTLPLPIIFTTNPTYAFSLLQDFQQLTINLNFTPSAIPELTNSIFLQNLYPPNPTLPFSNSLINLSSPIDQEYLKRIWSTHLAPRRPTEEVDCRTFELGALIYPQNRLKKQFWYQLQTHDYQLPDGAKEGGCLCDAFYAPNLGCQGCLDGLGGEGCKFPYQRDPILAAPLAVCANHQQSITIKNYTIYYPTTQFTDQTQITINYCNFLLFLGNYYKLFYQNTIVQIYTFNHLELSIIQGGVYFNQQILQTTKIQYSPDVWGTNLGEIQCIGIFNQDLLITALPDPIL